MILRYEKERKVEKWSVMTEQNLQLQEFMVKVPACRVGRMYELRTRQMCEACGSGMFNGVCKRV